MKKFISVLIASLSLVIVYSYLNGFYRLLFLWVFITIGIPFSSKFIMMILKGATSKQKYAEDMINKNSYQQEHQKNTIRKECDKKEIEQLQKKEYKKDTNYKSTNKSKTTKVRNDKEYIILRDSFKELIQGKALTHKQINEFLNEIDLRMGSHVEVYKNFKFNNEAHEIYSKLKSSKFNASDYEYLYDCLLEITKGERRIC